MKMKKMLAILAALSVLGTTGLTVGAEDTATTTEPATEAITTTETEAETTAAETTAETETETTVETDVTEETAATEENQVVKMEDASDEITIDGVSFTVKVSVASDSSVVLSVLKDGNVTNLNNICVESKVSGELQVGNYYSVDSNNRLTIYGVDGNHNYGWSNEYNVFVASSLREEGENLEIIDASTFQMNGKTVKITLWSYENELFDELSRISVYVDGKLTNLSGIVVNTSVLGYVSPGNIYQRSVHQYFSVSGNVLTIKPDSDYGKTASYTFDNASGQFVTAGTAPTTTTTTAAETTTTTTTTKKEDAQPVTGDFQLDGVTLTPKIEYKGQMGDEDAGLLLNIYSSDGTLLLSLRVELPSGGSGRPEDYDKVSRYLVKTGSNTITVIDYTGSTVKYHSYVFENGKFVSTGTTTDDNQEKTFTVEIPYTYFTITDSVTGKVMTDPGASKSVVNIEQITCTNGNVTSLNCGCEVSGSSDRFLQSFTVSDVKPGTLTIKAACGSYSYLPQEYTDAGYTTFRNSGNAIFDYLTVNVTIDENGNIVTGGSDNGDSGKTDNGSASNAPATKNTSGTPKTGDMTTVPAVAVGLTLTAAGVVAFISKRKK